MKNYFSTIERNGFLEEEGFFASQDIDKIKEWIDYNNKLFVSGYFSIRDSGSIINMKSTPMEHLIEKYELIEKVKKIAEIKLQRAISTRESLVVLRCLAGESGEKHSNLFHYDSYAVTAIIPIEIPSTNESSGGLVMVPNLRPQRRGQLMNLMEKIIIQNRISSMLITFFINKGLIKSTKIKLKENNIYIFDGYRSLHASDKYNPEGRRVTLLIHLGLPGHNSFLDRFTNGLKNKVRGKKTRGSLTP